MQLAKIRETTAWLLMGVAVVLLLWIAAASGTLMESEKISELSAAKVRADIFAKNVAAAMFPRRDLFEIHFLVNVLKLDRTLSYAAVLAQNGLIISHSDPGMIGVKDTSRRSESARRSGIPMMQPYKGEDGENYYYFSNPVVIGKKRLGTAVMAVSDSTLQPELEPLRQKLRLISFASLAALPLLWQLLVLMRKERRAAELRSSMIHTVSHEFNNSITVISASLFLLRETEPDINDERRRAIYATLQFEMRSLGRYVANILNEARMDAGRFKLQKQGIILRTLIYSIVTSMDALLRQKRISMSMDIPDAPAEVEADREAMSLVVSNLVGNAIKYTPEEGTILVRLRVDDARGSLVFSIENSGNGLRPEEIHKLKQEFYRTEDGKAAASGFGLGLRITNELLRLHGSELEIRGEPGRSACFLFSLSITKAKGQHRGGGNGH